MRAHLIIEGCYQNCSLTLNEARLALHPYGYTTFSVDITDHLKKPVRRRSNAANPSKFPGGLATPAWLRNSRDEVNRLEIRVESRGDNSRWYSGAGLYRPVSLSLHPSLYVPVIGGVHITTPRIDLHPETGGTQASTTGEVHRPIWSSNIFLCVVDLHSTCKSRYGQTFCCHRSSRIDKGSK